MFGVNVHSQVFSTIKTKANIAAKTKTNISVSKNVP